jgi:hypothetical protein
MCATPPPRWPCSRPCKSWCWANHCLPRPARGCSVGSLKPAPATSACARGPGLEGGDKTGTAGSSGTANDVAVLWPPGASGHRGAVLVTCYLTRSAVAPEQRRCRDCCCRPRGGEGKLGIARNLIAGVQAACSRLKRLKSSTSSLATTVAPMRRWRPSLRRSAPVATMFLGVIKRLVCLAQDFHRRPARGADKTQAHRDVANLREVVFLPLRGSG